MAMGPALEALEAVGEDIRKSLRLIQEEFEREERSIQERGDCRFQMQVVADAEEKARKDIARRQLELEAATLRCREKAAAKRQQQREQEALQEQITEEMWQVVAWGNDIVPLDVDGVHFEASASTLQRSPWFARRLADGGPAKARIKAKEPLARRRERMRVNRDGGYFKTILSYLRLGGDNARESCGFLWHCLEREEKERLLEDALFFELPGLAGQLAEPPVGAKLELRLKAKELAAKGVDALLFHKPCGTWHTPGSCFDLRCMREGVASVEVEVTGYRHGGQEPTWTVECHGQEFTVLRSQFKDFAGEGEGVVENRR